MNEILDLLKNPGWWFSAVIVAIVASLTAGYLKDAIPSWLANVSKQMKRRRRATLRRNATTIRVLAYQPALIAVYGVSLLLRVFFGFGGFMYGLVGPICLDYYRTHPQLDPIRLPSPPLLSACFPFLALALVLLACVSLFTIPERIRIFHRARYRAYTKGTRALAQRKLTKV